MKEGRLKFNSRPGGVLNPEPSGWPSEILLTVPTSHTLSSVGNLICMWHDRRSLARGWGNLFTFGGGLDRIKGPCNWGIITVWFCLMANAPYLPGEGGGGLH